MNVRRSIRQFLINSGAIQQFQPGGNLLRQGDAGNRKIKSNQIGHSVVWPIAVIKRDVLGHKYGVCLFDGYKAPFDIVPPKEDDHNYDLCLSCKAEIKRIADQLAIHYKSQKKDLFPEGLLSIPEFKREDYTNASYQAACKVLYTINYISNFHDSADWYRKLTDYISLAAISFGQFPAECGGGSLFLGEYFQMVNSFLNSENNIPTAKREALVKYINSYESGADGIMEDFIILEEKFKKWLALFPFDIHTYFADLREQFAKQFTQIIFRGEQHNIHTGTSMPILHTPQSFMDFLWKITFKLLDKISAEELYKNGVIPDFNKLDEEFIYAEVKNLKAKRHEDQLNASNEERKFSSEIEFWLKLQIDLWAKYKPIIIKKQEKINNETVVPLGLKNIKNNFDGTPIERVYSHFKILVDKGFFTESELLQYLKSAFDIKANLQSGFKSNTFVLKHYSNKERHIYPVFHHYYSKVARKGKLKQLDYVKLLGDYFEGFDNSIITKNFSNGDYFKLLNNTEL